MCSWKCQPFTCFSRGEGLNSYILERNTLLYILFWNQIHVLWLFLACFKFWNGSENERQVSLFYQTKSHTVNMSILPNIYFIFVYCKCHDNQSKQSLDYHTVNFIFSNNLCTCFNMITKLSLIVCENIYIMKLVETYVLKYQLQKKGLKGKCMKCLEASNTKGIYIYIYIIIIQCNLKTKSQFRQPKGFPHLQF